MTRDIQTEQAKTILHEDAISIAAFYQRFANAKLSNPATRDLLLHSFIDKITASKQKLTIATRYYDGGEPITHEQLTRHNMNRPRFRAALMWVAALG